MSAGTKRVSIVVATKDRYETLFDCVRSLLIKNTGLSRKDSLNSPGSFVSR